MEGIVNTAKRLLVMVLLLCMAFSALSAQDADDILLADVPIAYGEARFRERIFERTQGERSAVGLVLSGGSARAFAHIGVLKYLEEQGIVPDFIISNSMGSIVGLMYAAGLSPDQILESITSVSIQSLFDLTLPLQGGLLDSSRFIAKMTSLLGENTKLEELPIPIIVIAEDMVTKRQILISEGDFSTVLRASYALPVYFQPVEFRGHLLL
ncbi:MAG: patatin, partial [Spirochaetia bacterium]|nr:patatin [Spirochaetia bacterium]